MNITLANTYDISGGAGKAAYRLHKGLINLGVQSEYFVFKKDTNDYTVTSPVSKGEKFSYYLYRQLESLPLLRYRDRLNKGTYSIGWISSTYSNKLFNSKAQLIHLHWINHGFIDIKKIKKIKKPIVWTLHDMWAFTGGCHYSNGCEKYKTDCHQCFILNSKVNKDVSNKNFRIKRKLWKDINIVVVSPSKWLADCARESEILKEKKIEVIPNGIDTDIFKPINKKFARDTLNLPQDKKLILFGAIKATADERKGYSKLKEALSIFTELDKIKNDYGLVVIGGSKPKNEQNSLLKSYYLGDISDATTLALIYSSADVFVAPSLQDNLPNMVMESLSCGIPIVSFNVGGLKDMIDHLKNGYLATPFNVEDLAKGIEWVLKDDNRYNRLREFARAKVENEYRIELIAQKYFNLYNKVSV